MSNEINLQEFKMHEKDSGSSSYQIARLTQRLAHLTEHLAQYQSLIQRLGLRR